MNRTLSILALALTYMVFAMLLNSVAPVILQSMLTFGVDKAATSTLDACKDIPIALTSLLVAPYLPRVGYRRSMIIGLALVALACTSMPLASSFLATRLTFVAIGITFALIKVSVYSSIGLVTSDPKQHASITSTIEGLFMVGVLATSWVFSAFIDRGNPGNPVWLHVYWVLGGLAAAAAVIWSITPLDESRIGSTNAATTEKTDVREMIRLAWKPLVAVFLASAFIYVLIEQAVQTWLPTFNNEALGLSAALSVQLASVYSAGLAAGRLGAGVLLRFVRWPTLLTVCLITAAGLLLVSVQSVPTPSVAPSGWGSLPVRAYILPLLGLFLAPVYPTICSAMLSALPIRQHASMTGLIVVFSALGGTLGSFITGRVFAATDGRTAFMLALIPMGLLLVLLMLFDRRLKVAPATE